MDGPRHRFTHRHLPPEKSKNTNTHGGGLVGALLTAALDKDDQLSTCSAGDLPEPARIALDPKGKLAAKQVVIIPLATVSLVKSTRWNNSIRIEAGSDKFTVATSLFKLFATPRTLREMGWTLNTPLTPTAAPVHDTRTEQERVAPPAKALWLRVLMIIGAIALIIAVIAIRVLLGH